MSSALGVRSRRALRVAVTALAGVLLIFTGLAVGGAGPASAAEGRGVTRLSQLRNAPIPASCEHKATRLNGFSKDFGKYKSGAYKGDASLDTKKVVFVALGPTAYKYAVMPLYCNAGGVGWPELLLVYAAGPRLVGSVDLRNISTAQEHEDVSHLSVVPHAVRVAFTGYDGAGFAVSTYRGRLWLFKGVVRFRHSDPLTVDYAVGGAQSGGFGPGIYSGRGDGIFFAPAPKSLRLFVAHRYRLLKSKYGAHGTAVEVARYSHHGFAFGAESMGWESVVLYGRVKGAWTRLGNWGDGPTCRSLSRLQIRGLTATHGFCFSRKGGIKYLGSWPRSGQ